MSNALPMSEFLIKAKALIDSPEKWTQGAFARDNAGYEVPSLDSSACRFCSGGAILRTCYQLIPDEKNSKQKENIVIFMLESLNTEFQPNKSITSFNDNNTFEDVMLWWDNAIETAKEQEKK